VTQHEDEWKTKASIFASPIQLGKLPYSYTGTRQELVRAAKAAGIGHVSTHNFRHSDRSWLSSIGTWLDVTKLLMRHSTIAMSMDTYGDVVGDEASKATRRIAELLFAGTERTTERNQAKPLKRWWGL
jgi:integrase